MNGSSGARGAGDGGCLGLDETVDGRVPAHREVCLRRDTRRPRGSLDFVPLDKPEVVPPALRIDGAALEDAAGCCPPRVSRPGLLLVGGMIIPKGRVPRPRGRSLPRCWTPRTRRPLRRRSRTPQRNAPEPPGSTEASLLAQHERVGPAGELYLQLQMCKTRLAHPPMRPSSDGLRSIGSPC
jgi:hypothetical protein